MANRDGSHEYLQIILSWRLFKIAWRWATQGLPVARKRRSGRRMTTSILRRLPACKSLHWPDGACRTHVQVNQ
ncbi:two component transcriptional regulator [Pseudomonas mandelii JR-1]|uniref:Two component transcriptional regulator n=1 Tax=Pseudomonas mandelii JR-1 TaxID=1147786 RepID=A0A024EHS5_9PSED|nr:two component transcriptional regulator [Pseudomonas mandelii JR-1]